ncbi:MCE family protein [Mycobacterium sherrisii]|uniref:Mammalian cell entry protein n=1 Tax=Mycobacterium sherrisii TaxID=243061 RepID=A0A1E3SSL5_9MYCO|nr:MCE family protein [Mycobacterium sherrisii]MCV7032305.1 MCE family protein [Mycobacterium sherrisii]MEC4764272.1 MCE family protein [Mycobacterium sherrisii]ODR05144.1 mammalian cell entry protein [Mycobacterium sherrisii]ORW74559.1 mammalian cell entry protein [Mycobacterium sherrisii]
MRSRTARIGLATVLALCLIGGGIVAVRATAMIGRHHIVAYFDNSNGIFRGDEIRVLGVPVGKIDSIEPEPDRAKITFWVDEKYKIPADVKAVIISPQLVTSRAIQLTPAYTGGPVLGADAVIPKDHTAVPVEWDDFRKQLQTLTETLQPTEHGGVSPLGAFINTTAANLRGQGANIRDTIIKLSQAFSVLGDHSTDIFATIKNLSILAAALQSSTDLMAQLNRNLAAVTSSLSHSPDEVGRAVNDINSAAIDVKKFVADNRDALGTTSDKLASITKAVYDSLDDVKQTLHVAPNAFQNFVNIFEPGNAAATGILAVNNFSNPISFLCGAIQAASRLNAEQSAKLCVQYLAPIIKNRQLNFPPIGINPFVGPMARPNEITYSEDWMRPDYRPAPPQGEMPPPPGAPPPHEPAALPGAPLAAEAGSAPAAQPGAASIDPAGGLPALMVPRGGGS